MAVTEILASVDDINTHLPTDKIDADSAEAETEINLLEVDAVRLVRGLLSGTFTAVQLASWSSPSATPDQIRQIAGRVIAAKYYSVRYAEDSDISEYAQGLYNDAIAMINGIREGSVIVLDSDLNPVLTVEGGTGFTPDDFWPNNSTAPPKFAMDKDFA